MCTAQRLHRDPRPQRGSSISSYPWGSHGSRLGPWLLACSCSASHSVGSSGPLPRGKPQGEEHGEPPSAQVQQFFKPPELGHANYFQNGSKKSCWRCPSRTGASRRVFLWWIHSTASELVPQQQCSSLGAPLPDQFAFLEANLQCLRPCGHKQSLAELRSYRSISRAAPFPERRCKT